MKENKLKTRFNEEITVTANITSGRVEITKDKKAFITLWPHEANQLAKLLREAEMAIRLKQNNVIMGVFEYKPEEE